MESLGRALTSKKAEGKRLALPWGRLDQRVDLHTQEMVMIEGAPGGGKSTLAVNLAMAVDYPVLYCAQDTPNSVLNRMAAIATGRSHVNVQRLMATEEGREQVIKELETVRPTLVFERGAQTPDRLRLRIEGLAEWLGAPPPLIIIDNLIDMEVDGDGRQPSYQDPQFYSVLLPKLKRMAQEYDTVVMLLHHVLKSGMGELSQAKAQGIAGLNMNDMLHGGSRESRHVWGVYHNTGNTVMYVQILKQQDGPADPGGGLKVPLTWLPEHAKLVDNLGHAS